VTHPVWCMMHSKTIEPDKRKVGGRFGWASHRFPIKNGISPREALIRDAARRNPFLADLLANSPKPSNA